jgi:preprotein translocase SecE subunit
MATAIETSSQSQAPSPPAGLLTASLIGSVYVLASLAVVLYAVPALWEQFVSPALGNNKPADWFLWCLAEFAAAAGLIWFGHSLAGANPPKGIRGGVFLIVLAVVIIGFFVFAFGTTFEGVGGQVFTIIVGIALVFGAFKLFTSLRGERWMVSLEEQGWFHAKPFKRVLGVKVRRLTILGILLLGASGVYSLYTHGSLPQEWTVRVPFTQVAGAPEGTLKTFTLLKYAQLTVPTVLFLLTLWFAYRAVNVPTFAEFLIATEAEMNKVSWTSRKRLAQDTVVVLVTTILMAVFLLVVDLFWGWLLSSYYIGVLPAKSTEKQNKQVLEAKW